MEVGRLGCFVAGEVVGWSLCGSGAVGRAPGGERGGVHVAAVVKLVSVGVPAYQLWEDAGYTPTQIARFLEMRTREPQVPLVKPIEKTAPATITSPRTTTVGRDGAGNLQIVRGGGAA